MLHHRIVGTFALLGTATWFGCSELNCQDTQSCPYSLPNDGGTSDVADDALDHAPPQVLAISPAHGEVGVQKTASIVVTFSEPMDQPATEAAYYSDDLPSSAVTMNWNANGSILTITPRAPLGYATGADPIAVTARRYSFQIGGSARDRNRNLLEPLSSNFSTLRQINQRLTGTGGHFDILGYTPCNQDYPFAPAGDREDNVTLKVRSVIDISPLPSGVAEFTSATFRTAQYGTTGNPYMDLGPLLIEHVYVAEPTAQQLMTGPALSPAITLATSKAAASADVLQALQDDYARRTERRNESQYRIGFPKATDNDNTGDSTAIVCNDFTIMVSYLIP